MLKFNQIKPGMVFHTRGFGEIIIVLSVGLSLFKKESLQLVCLAEDCVFNMFGGPDNQFPHNLLQPD